MPGEPWKQFQTEEPAAAAHGPWEQFQSTSATPEPGLHGPLDAAKYAAVGVSSLLDIPRALLGFAEGAPPAGIPSVAETLRGAMGLTPPDQQTLGQQASEATGAFAVPLGGEENLFLHLVKAGVAGVGSAAGSRFGKYIGGAPGEVVGGMVGALAPGGAARLVTGTSRAAAEAERAVGQGLETKLTAPAKEAVDAARKEYADRATTAGEWMLGPRESVPSALTNPEAATLRNQPGGVSLLSTLEERMGKELQGRYEDYQGPKLPNPLTAKAHEHLQTVAQDLLANEDYRGHVPTALRLNARRFIPEGRPTTELTTQAQPMATTVGDLKGIKDDIKPYLKNQDGTTAGFARKLYGALTDAQAMSGLPRNSPLAGEYTARMATWPAQAKEALRKVQSPAELEPFLQPSRLAPLWEHATIPERGQLRQLIGQWADASGKGIDGVLKMYPDADALDKFFGPGAGTAGKALRVKAFQDSLPKLFEHAPDLAEKVVTDARMNTIRDYNIVGGSIAARLTHGIAIYGGAGAAMSGTIPGHYVVGIVGAGAASLAIRTVSKGIAYALESQPRFQRIARQIGSGDTQRALKTLSQFGARVAAFEIAHRQGELPLHALVHHVTRPQDESPQ